MGFPALTKTWQFNVNDTVAAQANLTVQAQVTILAIKNALLSFSTNPWQVYYSCTVATGGHAGVAGDGVDRWAVATTDIFGNVAGSVHSWIVLKQPGLGANGCQICIDLNNNWGVGNTQISVIASFGAGFTGGSTTNRPTATDETVLLSNGNWYGQVAAQQQIHAMQSTDGQCTRLLMYRGTTNCGIYFQFDKLQNPVSGWATPIFACCFGVNAGLANSFANFQGGQNMHCFGAGGVTGQQFAAGLTYETYAGLTGGLCQATGIGTAVNTFTGNFPEFPMGLASGATGPNGNNGRLGNVFDMWWRPTSVADADTFPNNAAARQYAAFGGIVLPWKGDATVPLLT